MNVRRMVVAVRTCMESRPEQLRTNKQYVAQREGEGGERCERNAEKRRTNEKRDVTLREGKQEDPATTYRTDRQQPRSTYMSQKRKKMVGGGNGNALVCVSYFL